MNAKQLKAAFFYKTPVFSDDKEHPVKLGYVTEVIYSLSDSGKRKTTGRIQPWDNSKASEPVSCRHIHYISPRKRKKLPAIEPSERTELIRYAFLNTLPVVARVPTQGPVEGTIQNIVYWKKENGKVICSAYVLDVNCPRSTVKVRLEYIHIKGNGC